MTLRDSRDIFPYRAFPDGRPRVPCPVCAAELIGAYEREGDVLCVRVYCTKDGECKVQSGASRPPAP